MFPNTRYLPSIVNENTKPINLLKFSKLLETSNDKHAIEYGMFSVSKLFNDFNVEENLLNNHQNETNYATNNFADIIPQLKLLPHLLISVEKIHTKITKPYDLFEIYFKSASNAVISSPQTILQNVVNLYFHKNICIATYINSLSREDINTKLDLFTDFEGLYSQICSEVAKKELTDFKTLAYLLSRLESVLKKIDEAYIDYLSIEKNIQNNIKDGNYTYLEMVLLNYNKQNYKNLLITKQKKTSSNYDKHFKKINDAIDANKYEKASLLSKQLSLLTIENNYYLLPQLIKHIQTPPISQNIKLEILKKLESESSNTLQCILTLEANYWEIT